MNDSQYHQLADDLLMAIEDQADDFDDLFDYESTGGMVTLAFKDGSKIIINKQAPLHEIWVATKFNGHHFSIQQDVWHDKRGAGEFWQFLSSAASKQANQTVTFVAP